MHTLLFSIDLVANYDHLVGQRLLELKVILKKSTKKYLKLNNKHPKLSFDTSLFCRILLPHQILLPSSSAHAQKLPSQAVSSAIDQSRWGGLLNGEVSAYWKCTKHVVITL